jgi:hypothetical protein
MTQINPCNPRNPWLRLLFGADVDRSHDEPQNAKKGTIRQTCVRIPLTTLSNLPAPIEARDDRACGAL